MKSLLPDTSGNPSEVRLQLEQILVGKRFANAERMSRFLRFAVEHTLGNRAAELKEFVIGVEVFDRTADNDRAEQQANPKPISLRPPPS